MNISRSYIIASWLLTGLLISNGYAQVTGSRNNQAIDGYKGIWFALNQFTKYGDKYSGGLGTYTAHHIPMAIYAQAVNKTFFVYGGTTGESDRYLLCMAGSFDHGSATVSRPVVVHDKEGVDDPHDNPSILIDGQGYVWVFVSGRNTGRKGYKYRSTIPYSVDSFEQITGEVMTYPQPWYITDGGLQLHGSGGEVIRWESIDHGRTWRQAGAVTANSKRNHNYVRRVVNGKYFGDDRGKAWQLPYTTKQEVEKPAQLE